MIWYPAIDAEEKGDQEYRLYGAHPDGRFENKHAVFRMRDELMGGKGRERVQVLTTIKCTKDWSQKAQLVTWPALALL